MTITLTEIAELVKKHADPKDHVVYVDGVNKGNCCTHASIRATLSAKGFEFPVAYAYELDGMSANLTSRLRREGLGQDGHEQIKVNGHAVDSDDVVLGSEELHGQPAFHVEFRYKEQDTQKNRNIRFVAPLSAFK